MLIFFKSVKVNYVYIGVGQHCLQIYSVHNAQDEKCRNLAFSRLRLITGGNAVDAMSIVQRI